MSLLAPSDTVCRLCWDSERSWLEKFGWPWSGGRKGDILFLLGVERPSDNQPEATKILSSSQLVQTLATRLIVDTELLKVLEHDTTFLLSQLELARLEICCSVLIFIRITGNFSHCQFAMPAPSPLTTDSPGATVDPSPPSTSSIILNSPFAPLPPFSHFPTANIW